MIKNDATRWAPRAAAPDAEFVGLQAIADALAEVIGLHPDNATVCRWLGKGAAVTASWDVASAAGGRARARR